LWTEGAIVLVAGRIDHRGEEISVLADLVVDWDAAVVAGPEAFARQVAAGDRGRGGRRRSAAGHEGGDRRASERPPISGEPGNAATPKAPARPPIPYVSPLRADARREEGTGPASGLPQQDDEPPLPDELRDRALAADAAPTRPIDAPPGGVLHVRFRPTAGTERLVGAMEQVRTLLRDRPGGTAVVLHLPQGGGRTALPMELRTRVAYDAELLAELDRRLGDGVVELNLA